MVSDALVADGFRRIDRVHLMVVDDHFTLWVDTGPLGKRPDIAPFIGIRHDGVESLRAALLDSKSVETSGTVGANVGYILGLGYKAWEPPATANEVLTTITGGLDLLHNYLTVDRLVEVWNFEGAKRPGWQYSRIAAQLYRGDHGAVRRDLAMAEAEMCKYQDEVCAQFKLFARHVQQRLLQS